MLIANALQTYCLLIHPILTRRCKIVTQARTKNHRLKKIRLVIVPQIPSRQFSRRQHVQIESKPRYLCGRFLPDGCKLAVKTQWFVTAL